MSRPRGGPSLVRVGAARSGCKRAPRGRVRLSGVKSEGLSGATRARQGTGAGDQRLCSATAAKPDNADRGADRGIVPGCPRVWEGEVDMRSVFVYVGSDVPVISTA